MSNVVGNKVTMNVAASSNVNNTAGSIVKHWSEGFEIELSVIGAGALNQAVKAATTARGILATKGKTLKIIPGFGEAEIDGNKKTTMVLYLEIK